VCADAYCTGPGDISNDCLKKGVYTPKPAEVWHPSPTIMPTPSQPMFKPYNPPIFVPSPNEPSMLEKAFANRVSPPSIHESITPPFDFENAKVHPFKGFNS